MAGTADHDVLCRKVRHRCTRSHDRPSLPWCCLVVLYAQNELPGIRFVMASATGSCWLCGLLLPAVGCCYPNTHRRTSYEVYEAYSGKDSHNLILRSIVFLVNCFAAASHVVFQALYVWHSRYTSSVACEPRPLLHSRTVPL